MLDPTLLGPIERAVYDTVINKTQGTRFMPTVGTIINVNPMTWMACVEFMDPISHKRMSKDNVPIPNLVNGVKTITPKAGDRVSVSFIGGDIHAPQITNIYPSKPTPLGPHAKYGVETSNILGIF